MTKIEQLLLHCDDRMQHTNCEKCEYEGGCLRRLRSDCYECLSKIHKVYNHDLHYSCDKILYNYVLKHQIRYASEIAWGYNIISRIRKEFSPSPVIYSIGCGPASELYAIDEYSRNNFDKAIISRYIYDFLSGHSHRRITAEFFHKNSINRTIYLN